MRVTFTRLPDHQRGWALVERDDGVVYRMGGGPMTAELPHDLVHVTVERIAAMPDPTPARIRRLAGGYLATLPDGDLDLATVAPAATAVREMADRWRALAVGSTLTVEWPAWCRMDAAPSRRTERRTLNHRQSRSRGLRGH